MSDYDDVRTPSVRIDLLGAKVRWYDAGGIRTRAIEAGEGEVVIFLHSIGGQAEAFARTRHRDRHGDAMRGQVAHEWVERLPGRFAWDR